MDVVIRTAVSEDGQALQRYAAKLFDERLPGLFRRPASPSPEEEDVFIASRVGPSNSTLLLAVVDGAVVGVLDFDGGKTPQTQHAGVLGLSVDRDFRGRGVGSSLISSLLDWARDSRVSRLEAQVFANNPRAVQLYRRFGFQEEGRRVDAVRVDGEPVDVIVMARLLASRTSAST